MTFHNVSTTTTEPRTTTLTPGVVDVDPGAWGVAVALTVLVMMTLCLVVLYTKARRRRAAARGRHQSIRALSGGVPMGVGAYQNYEQRIQAYTNQNQQINSPGLPPAFVENPPSYEDAMREANTNYSNGILNMSYTGSNMNLSRTNSDQSVPPPYSPSMNNLQEPNRQSPVNTQQTSEPASTSGTTSVLPANKGREGKDKNVEIEDGVAANGDKESECSSSDPQTSTSSATQPTTPAQTSYSPATTHNETSNSQGETNRTTRTEI